MKPSKKVEKIWLDGESGLYTIIYNIGALLQNKS
jgi:hypothetical protein